MMGFAVMVGAILANPTWLNNSWQSLLYGFVTGFTLTAASMTINDYYDREIDSVNEPDRPIPSGAIKPRDALAFASFLTAMGFIAAFLTNLLCLVTAIVAWIIFVAYTTVGKRSGLPGNLLVSACVATPFIYGSIVITNEIRLNVLVFASMAFLSDTGREITKGIVDVKGDQTRNVKTLAVRYGEKTAAMVAVLFYLSAVTLSPLPWLLNLVSVWFIPFVVLTDLGIIASSFKLAKDYSRESARKVKNMILYWFIVGLIAFIAGTIP
jgi:geranylgeranylglycerol-phosphate geranylgeranyltransferase